MQGQRGFTLSELIIAMLLGLILISLAATAFNSVSRSTRQAQQLAQLQQNAQLIMTVLHNELANFGFWGGRGEPTLAAQLPLPAPPGGDCIEAMLDSGSFPQSAQSFVTLYARIASGGRQLNCLPNPITASEVLQLKRLLGQHTAIAEMRQNRFYLETGWQHSRIVATDSVGLNPRYDYFPYQHLVFYLQRQRLNGQTIPVLMRKRLSRNRSGHAVISTDSVLDGVERLHFEFGIDSNFDGQLDYQLATAQMPAELWQQRTGRIISLRYYVLLRARQPDLNYINTQRYQMGRQHFIAPADHYRRLLISSSIFFQNAVL
jgi:type IV pilus assembly protein PilW